MYKVINNYYGTLVVKSNISTNLERDPHDTSDTGMSLETAH